MSDSMAMLTAEELARLTPEARSVAIIRRSISVVDKNGAVHSVRVTDEILELCENILSRVV